MTYLLTYGTLRPGGALSDLTPGEHVGRATMSGRLYRHERAQFPVLLDAADTDRSVVVGDVFHIDARRSRQLDFVLEMETGAGYDVRIREATLTDLAEPWSSFSWVHEGDIVPVITFVWPDRYPTGPRIYCGDWFSPEAADVCTALDAGAGFTSRRMYE